MFETVVSSGDSLSLSRSHLSNVKVSMCLFLRVTNSLISNKGVMPRRQGEQRTRPVPQAGPQAVDHQASSGITAPRPHGFNHGFNHGAAAARSFSRSLSLRNGLPRGAYCLVAGSLTIKLTSHRESTYL